MAEKIPKAISLYMARMGRKGGVKSRRALSPEQATLMVKIREAQRAFRNHHARCFWSYDPKLKISAEDIPWVADQLMKNGNRVTWLLGKKLCR